MNTGTLPIPISFEVYDQWDNVSRPDGRDNHWAFEQVRLCVKDGHGHYGKGNYIRRDGSHVPHGAEIVTASTYEQLRVINPNHHLVAGK